ncbi:STAS domain-containing protein [Alkalicoccus chagannorensis]|uniref:STAS domain-containing protein n=1 Tax=Alkalicoccus chagannorensis TaxID=427072 RepID=UPI000429B754|nr:STAS domain-containing protein [Alkalicoccus chagannorensis]
MKIETIRQPGSFMLEGRMETQEALDLRKEVIEELEEADGHIGLDVSRLECIDSAGLGVFVSLKNRAEKAGGSFVIDKPTGEVLQLLEMTRLTHVFQINYA